MNAARASGVQGIRGRAGTLAKGDHVLYAAWLVACLVAGVLALVLPPSSTPEPGAVAELGPKAALEALGRLPLRFEPNHGQIEAPVRFLARGAGYGVFLTPTETVMALTRAGAAPEVLRMRFVSAEGEARWVGSRPLAGTVNYLEGQEPSRWHTGIHLYAEVKAEGVYPGVAVRYHGRQGLLEYDLELDAGVDPSVIELAFQGARRLTLEPGGDLLLDTGQGSLRQRRPRIYQDIDGRIVERPGGYVKRGEDAIGFHIAAYDRGHPLVIDPVLEYSTYLGGAREEAGLTLALDGEGHPYVAGSTTSLDFPLSNALQPQRAGSTDAFIVKFAADGQSLIYATYLGGGGIETGLGIAVDALGQAHLTGLTTSGDFPLANARQATRRGLSDAFVTKLSVDGDALLYSTYLGGGGIDTGLGIAIDGEDQVFVTGATTSSDFPRVNALQTSRRGLSDAFVTKLASDGQALLYSTYLGGEGIDGGAGIALDALGQAHVVGQTTSSDFPLTNALQTTRRGLSDVFITKLSANGSAKLYSTYLGGGGIDTGVDIAVDALGQAHLTGETTSSDFPRANALQTAVAA